MRTPTPLVRSFCLALACLLPVIATAQKQTVCTITLNSDNEWKSFRRHLPQDKYDFVELVERNRPDWLASACQAKVSCDVLVISGHYGEGDVFFSDALDIRDNLPIKELERVSCSDSCPNLFEHLKEVYLFGCNTLNPLPHHTITSEIARSFAREGRSPQEAASLARQLGVERGESSRDRMRMVFHDVPVIYGFSAPAPLGPVAASFLDGWFRNGGAREVGKGRPSSGLLRQFGSHSLTALRGITAGDPLLPLRQDVCTFANDRSGEAQRLAAVHELLQRPIAQSRLLLGRIEGVTATLDADARKEPQVARALADIAQDRATRDRYLAFARDADEPGTRARMFAVARDLGWLSAEEHRAELASMFRDLLARKEVAGPAVDLACRLNEDGSLDGLLQQPDAPVPGAQGVGESALRACLGDQSAHARALAGLVSPSEADVRIAQFYLRQRPVSDVTELRELTRAIAGMRSPDAQARALDVLARHYISDRESVKTLEQLFATTRAWPVQNAIAGVLIRADPDVIAGEELLRTVREFRLKASPGGDMVDALIHRLQLS